MVSGGARGVVRARERDVACESCLLFVWSEDADLFWIFCPTHKSSGGGKILPPADLSRVKMLRFCTRASRGKIESARLPDGQGRGCGNEANFVGQGVRVSSHENVSGEKLRTYLSF